MSWEPNPSSQRLWYVKLEMHWESSCRKKRPCKQSARKAQLGFLKICSTHTSTQRLLCHDLKGPTTSHAVIKTWHHPCGSYKGGRDPRKFAPRFQKTPMKPRGVWWHLSPSRVSARPVCEAVRTESSLQWRAQVVNDRIMRPPLSFPALLWKWEGSVPLYLRHVQLASWFTGAYIEEFSFSIRRDLGILDSVEAVKTTRTLEVSMNASCMTR